MTNQTYIHKNRVQEFSALSREERKRWSYLSDKKYLPGGVTREEWLEWASLNQRLRATQGQNKKTQKDIKDK